jgi:vitamin K-dependent gamma-carboxylase-like protein
MIRRSGGRSRVSGPPHRVQSLVVRTFGIDPRSLAAVRIGFGAIIVIDLAFRAGRLRAAYTDAGAVPRSMLDSWLTDTIAPFHLLSGDFGWEAALFAVAAIAGFCLLIGFHTRIAAVVSWLLLTSLQVRNPFLLNFGDHILRVTMFWALFLPLGRCWSVDAARAGRPASHDPVCSVASAAFLLQVCVIYFFTAILKSGPDWHEDATALYYAMQLDWLVLPLGTWLREYFAFTKLITRATIVLELVGPFLLIMPVWPLRLAAAIAFASLHLGISATLRLGVFPWIDVTVLLAFVPREAWDWLVGRIPRAADAAPPASTDSSAAIRRALSAVMSAGLAVLLGYVVLHNVAGVWSPLALPETTERGLREIGLQQKWLMFTPNVPKVDGWFVMPAKVAEGRIIDVSPHGPDLHWAKPVRISTDFESARWAQYLHQLSNLEANGSLRRAWVRWLCRDWNDSHSASEQLERVDVYFVTEHSELPGREQPVQAHFLASHECPRPGVRPSRGWDATVPSSGPAPPPLVQPPASLGAAR